MLWVETYRPSKIEDCILPADLKKTFAEFVKKNYDRDWETSRYVNSV